MCTLLWCERLLVCLSQLKLVHVIASADTSCKKHKQRSIQAVMAKALCTIFFLYQHVALCAVKSVEHNMQ
jgi:hypothetical protein